MATIAIRWSIVAGVAWLVGFGQFVLIWAGLGLGLPLLLIGFAIYGAWALGLGFMLLRRPKRTILAVSLVFAIVSLVLNWAALPAPALEGPYWLSWVPDAVAGIASLAGVLASRKQVVTAS
jgi:hypothetical protein